MVADDLARARVPVLVKVLNNLPGSFEALGATYENAARLRGPGCRWPSQRRDLQAYNIRQEAVTRWPTVLPCGRPSAR